MKIAVDMAGEQRSTSAMDLFPKGYADVHLSVCEKLRLWDMYLMEIERRGAPVLNVYSRFQGTKFV